LLGLAAATPRRHALTTTCVAPSTLGTALAFVAPRSHGGTQPSSVPSGSMGWGRACSLCGIAARIVLSAAWGSAHGTAAWAQSPSGPPAVAAPMAHRCVATACAAMTFATSSASLLAAHARRAAALKEVSVLMLRRACLLLRRLCELLQVQSTKCHSALPPSYLNAFPPHVANRSRAREASAACTVLQFRATAMHRNGSLNRFPKAALQLAVSGTLVGEKTGDL